MRLLLCYEACCICPSQSFSWFVSCCYERKDGAPCCFWYKGEDSVKIVERKRKDSKGWGSSVCVLCMFPNNHKKIASWTSRWFFFIVRFRGDSYIGFAIFDPYFLFWLLFVFEIATHSSPPPLILYSFHFSKHCA